MFKMTDGITEVKNNKICKLIQGIIGNNDT